MDLREDNMPVDKDISKVLIIGSGPIQIGQAAEFDYSGSQACKSLREEGLETVLVNSNPATIQTDMDMADTVYTEPLTPELVRQIIEKENIDAILPTMGGQTGLNIATELGKLGLLEGIKVIGSDVQTIADVEDRDLFANFMDRLNEPIPKCQAVESVEEALEAVEDIGYPVIVRPAFTLGGTGGGVANNEEELIEITNHGLDMSYINQVLIDESVLGWKEIEFEVMRDKNDTCIIVCNMENVDPMGIHTGDSIVVAPIQNLNDEVCQRLRDASIKIIRNLGINGGCNIQFALNPETNEYKIIEVNPRVSRSSALASKATGYPIAKISSKVALGLTLDEIKNDITKETPASFEPSIDYIVVKIPRWPFDKFKGIDRKIGVQMKATGEVMAIGRTYEEAIQKAIRSLDIGLHGFEYLDYTEDNLINPTDERLFQFYSAIKDGRSVEELAEMSKMDAFFLYKIKNIVDFEAKVTKEASRMFWKISGTDKEGKTSVVYVQGTIHIGSKNLFPLDKAVLDAFASADLVAGELSADDMNSIQIKAVRLIQESFIKAGGKKISDSLSQEEIASLNTLLGSSMVVTSLDRAEPWVLSLSLLGKTVQETTDLSANYSVDSYFLKLASESSKEVIGLDDIQAQFDVLTFGTYEQQLKILKATIKECSDPKSIQETKAELENLYAAYLADDVAKVALISQSSNEKDISDYDDFGEEYLKVVYDRRNEDWANDIKGFLEKGGVSFIFAGCAHWVGKKSVFEYMRSQGTIE